MVWYGTALIMPSSNSPSPRVPAVPLAKWISVVAVFECAFRTSSPDRSPASSQACSRKVIVNVRMWDERYKQGGSEHQWPTAAPCWWQSEPTGGLTPWESERRLWGGGGGYHRPKGRLSQLYWWHSSISWTLLVSAPPDTPEASFDISSGNLEIQQYFSKSGP